MPTQTDGYDPFRFWGSHNKTNYFAKNATNLSKLLQYRESRDTTDKSAEPDNKMISKLLVMGQTPCAHIPGAMMLLAQINLQHLF